MTNHDVDRKRELGAFYTPPWAVDHMVAQIDAIQQCSTFLEPSGGDGAFVEGLLRAGVSPDQITVWDVNDTVREPLEDLGVAVEIGDSLLRTDTLSFDVVVGNPPYLNKASDYIRTHKRELSKPYARVGVNDTYAMFTYMAVERLNPGGQLIFLISDTFLTLGIHQKLRTYLLENTRIDSVTLLPTGTFPDASVNTAILKVTRTPAPPGHRVDFWDCRTATPGQLTGSHHFVSQAGLATGPAAVFSFTDEARSALALASRSDKLMDHLDGGLGMHTTDNGTFLARPFSNQFPIFRPYHKRGGASRWFAPIDHVVDWSDEAQGMYGIPATALEGVDNMGNPRRGLVLSGVSSRLSARTMVRGAMWESNKVFGLFPKDESQYPVEFFIAVLNSATYSTIARALNHTVSLQVRDLKNLPMLDFTQSEVGELTQLGVEATAWVRDGGSEPLHIQHRIDEIVAEVASRS